MYVRTVWYISVILVGILVLVLCHQWVNNANVEASEEDNKTTHRRKIRIMEPLPHRTFQNPHEVQPKRSKAGTLIPLVVHTNDSNIVEDWEKQGWQVRVWSTNPDVSLVERYFGAGGKMPQSLWPYLVIYDQGGFFTDSLPGTRSLRNYLVYTGFDVSAVFFKDTKSTFAAQQYHPAIKAMLESQQPTRMDLKDVRILDQTTFMIT